jgi:hypothetical protein
MQQDLSVAETEGEVVLMRAVAAQTSRGREIENDSAPGPPLSFSGVELSIA